MAVTLACLLPFIGKPFHIDDPLFIWCARHLHSEPFNFYNFNVNWEGHQAPMWAVTQNPPLAAYYLALVAGIAGWSEASLHTGFLLPALAAVIGTFYLARNLCSHPLAVALITAIAPVFLISSTNVMCDTMMLAFWVWSLSFWVEGLRQTNYAKLALAAALVAASSLTKYFGMALIPLLVVYSIVEKRRLGRWALYLLIPIIVIGFYHWITHRFYGRGLLLNAAAYATNFRVGGQLPLKGLAGLAFSGGCMIILIAAIPLLWGRRGTILGFSAIGLVGLFLIMMKKLNSFPVVQAGKVNWLFVIQMSLFVTAGACVVVLATAELAKERTGASILLFLWVAGVFTFACVINWTISGRNILPMLPAVSLLLVRRLEANPLPNQPPAPMRRLLAPAAISLVVALMAAQADLSHAHSAKTAAALVKRDFGNPGATVWFEGHWGFQYYMQLAGARPLDLEAPALAPNDLVVVPLNNSYIAKLPEEHFAPDSVYRLGTLKWLTCMNPASGAGYYADAWGPLPYVFGPVPDEQYQVFRTK